MVKYIDNFLNSITMYRLLLYYLILLIVVAFIYSIFGILPFTPFALVFSVTLLVSVCFVTNKVFAKIFKVQTNIESLYLTALILVCLITPNMTLSGIEFLVLAGILAMASKYILNISGKHIFNPAAIAVLITAFTIRGYASWWIGTAVMFPWTLLGFLIVRKIRRSDLVFYFFVTSLLTVFGLAFLRGNFNILGILKNTFFDSAILFFACVMLTEPMTSPPTILLQSIYGGLVGVLFAPIHVGIFFTTPEIALVLGNIFSYVVSPKGRLILKLREKIKLTDEIHDFIFEYKGKFNFSAGQYLEWTLGHKNPDSRGNRRYFTLSSSPTEAGIRIGVKFEDRGSSFKKEMLNMKVGQQIAAGQLAGDLTLPKDEKRKLVFVAGGIGVTPYRSIIKYLMDRNEQRDIVLIYSEATKEKMVYQDIFDEAKKKLSLKVIYQATGVMGRINEEVIMKDIPDFKERYFYLSGSHAMVVGFEEILAKMKIPKAQIKVDYFPGF